MGLHDRLARNGDAQSAADAAAAELTHDPYADLKARVHHACIAKLGPELFKQDESELGDHVFKAVTEELTLAGIPLTKEERRELVRQLTDDILGACVRGKLNMLISGGTGTGKTTTLNAVSAFIPGDERIVTIEDAAELQLQQEHVITLESRPANIEGTGEIKIRELVRNALRMRPDRIIVGEVRGAETLDMLQAMNTGHEGSLTTIHANAPRDALSRLETLVLTAGFELPLRAIREQISSAFDLLVQITRLVDGSRRITNITEVLRMESETVTLQDLLVAKPPAEQHADESGAVRFLMALQGSGLKPQFLDKMATHGVALQPNFFNEEEESGYRSTLSSASFGGFS